MFVSGPILPVTATSRDAPLYRFVEAEIDGYPFEKSRTCVRLDFAESRPLGRVSAFLTDSKGVDTAYFPTVMDPDGTRFSVFIPREYPPSVTSLQIALQSEDGLRSSWKVQGLPSTAIDSPALAESETIAPGVIVKGSAFSQFSMLRAGVHADFPGESGGWYWEAGISSPYSPQDREQNRQDWMFTGDTTDFPFLIADSPFASLLDRVRVSGELTHFQLFSESLTCKLRPDKDTETGRWRLKENEVFTTASGLRFRIVQPDEPFDRDPKNRDVMRFSVELDHTTLASGLQKAPDLIDLWITPPQFGIGFSPGQSVPEILKGAKPPIWTLQREMIKPETELKIKITRRTADRKLPFNLVLPLKKESTRQNDSTP